MLDPALKRSGRLDQVITVKYPNRAALEAILRQHLAPDLAEANLSSVAALGLGATGADAARWGRCAKRRARRDGGRPVSMEDIIAEVRGDAAPLPKRTKRRIAFHEAGHALVAALHRPGSVLAATIRINQWATAGVLSTSADVMTCRDEFEEKLVHLLAGRAAEEAGLSEAGCGAGGGPESDLAKATMLAVAMSTAFGLGTEDAEANPRLLWLGRPTEENLVALLTTRPDIAQEAATALKKAYKKASGIIDAHRVELNRIVKLLLEQETLSGSAVEDIVREAAVSRNAPKPTNPNRRRLGTPPRAH
jgi:cell division protease FtsH